MQQPEPREVDVVEDVGEDEDRGEQEEDVQQPDRPEPGPRRYPPGEPHDHHVADDGGGERAAEDRG